MTIIERVKGLGLPLDQVVVIASGILDALGLRKAGDVDLVITTELLDALSQMPEWRLGTKNGEPIITKDDTEAFLSWGSDGVPNFRELYDNGVTIEGVCFADPRFVINWKRKRMSDKDRADIAMLEEYLNNE